MVDAEDIYSRIYADDEWHGGSGPGSTADASAEYRRIVARLLVSPEIRTVVDVGCGDWQVGSLIDWSAVEYTGFDVVPAVIQANQERFATDRISFQVADARSAQLPTADLLLIKDVLQHWPSADVAHFLATTVPRYRYALITNDIASQHFTGTLNQDIAMGEWRCLELTTPPFDLAVKHQWQFDINGGEWTKQVLLVGNRRRWLAGELIPRSVRRIARSI